MVALGFCCFSNPAFVGLDNSLLFSELSKTLFSVLDNSLLFRDFHPVVAACGFSFTIEAFGDARVLNTCLALHLL